LYFAISPNPAAKSTPLATNIGYKDTPASTPSDGNFFFLTDTDITTSHALKTCVLIGGINMSKDSSDDWAVAALTALDGGYINPRPFEGLPFTFPLGQMGSSSNNILAVNSSAPPSFSAPSGMVRNYYVGLDGFIDINMSTQDGGTVSNGGGANQSKMAIPYKYIGGDTQESPIGKYYVTGVGSGILIGNINPNESLVYLDSATTANIENNDWSNAANFVRTQFRYKAF